jgi:hypothetical protein
MLPPRALVFVKEESLPVRAQLARLLETVGARVHYAKTATGNRARTMPVQDFKCAFISLDRATAKDDPIDAAEVLRLYHPMLPVAFLDAGSDEALLERARCVGPIFAKPDQLDAAVAWAAQHIA